MRTLPVALAYADTDTMLRQSALISAMTHWDAQAEVCCAIYCLWIQGLLAGETRHEAWGAALVHAKQMADRQPLPLPETPGTTPLPAGFWARWEAVENPAGVPPATNRLRGLCGGLFGGRRVVGAEGRYAPRRADRVCQLSRGSRHDCCHRRRGCWCLLGRGRSPGPLARCAVRLRTHRGGERCACPVSRFGGINLSYSTLKPRILTPCCAISPPYCCAANFVLVIHLLLCAFPFPRAMCAPLSPNYKALALR